MKKRVIYGILFLIMIVSNTGFAQNLVISKVGQWNGGVGGYYKDVIIQNGYSYGVLYRRGLVIADISGPASPRYLGECSTPNDGRAIDVKGNYAYIAGGGEGLSVIDITNPSTPVLIGFCRTETDALGVAVSGDFAYVTEKYRMNIIDISNPAAPVRKGYLDTSKTNYMQISDITVKDDQVILLNGSNVSMIDVSRPSAPAILGECTLGSTPSVVAVSGNYAVVGTLRSQVFIVDISDPTNPISVTSLGKVSIQAYTGIHIAGNYAFLAVEYSYITNTSTGMYTFVDIIDISEITKPKQTTRYAHTPNYFNPGGISVFGNHAYVATSNGLLSIDVSNPSSPSLNTTAYKVSGKDMQMAGNKAYVAAGAAGVIILDVSDPTVPKKTGSCCAGGDIVNLHIDGKYLYAADSGYGLRVIDISNPSSPTQVKSLTKYKYAEDVFIEGKYAYLGAGKLYILDISNPVSPTEIAQYHYPYVSGLPELIVRGDYLYGIIGNDHDIHYLMILDISDPSNPLLIWDSGDFTPRSLALSGNYLYIGKGIDLGVLDITSPGSASWVTQYKTKGALYNTHIQDKYLYAAGQYYGLQIIDISSPLSPSIKGSYSAINNATAVYADGGYIYLTDSLNGSFHVLRALDLTVSPGLQTDRSRLNFAYVLNSAGSPSSQGFRIDNIGGGQLEWSLSETKSWLECSRYSGRGGDEVRVSVFPQGLSTGVHTADITISDSSAAYSPVRVNVVLTVLAPGTTQMPFGHFATPIDQSIARGSIPVTGWVLDDVGVSSVAVYRGIGKNLTYIGDAVFVAGARPDVELAYPSYPMNYKAGWGYMLLTNYLPNAGNGTFTLHAIATDYEGNQTTLGTRTIVCDNANGIKPFGAIETPAQGGFASGSEFINWGWALAPQPNTIPFDGSTIKVWVDSVELGSPVYNLYRKDIATYFPGYNNSSGAVGYFFLDTTQYANGVHSIQWTVTDSAGNTDGIGSRYFTITNSSVENSRQMAIDQVHQSSISRGDQEYIPGRASLAIRKGFQQDGELQRILPDDLGEITIELSILERLELHLPVSYGQDSYGFQLVGNQHRPLPIGSTFDRETKTYSWIPGPGYQGEHTLVFITKTPRGIERQIVRVVIKPE